MIVYNIGLPRTGTKSITHLLEGYGFVCKHPNITTNNFDYKFLIKNINQWCIDNTVYSNTPVWHPEFWNLLNIEKHKIIYTYRDNESWINSILNYSYFKRNKLLIRDEYWFKSYFDGFDYENLLNVFNKHLNAVNQLKNVLFVDIINDTDIEKTKKICDYLNIEYNSNLIIKNIDYEIKHNNTMQ